MGKHGADAAKVRGSIPSRATNAEEVWSVFPKHNRTPNGCRCARSRPWLFLRFCYSNDDCLPEVSLQLREFKLSKNTNKRKKKSRSCQDGCSHVDLQSQIYGSMSFFFPQVVRDPACDSSAVFPRRASFLMIMERYGLERNAAIWPRFPLQDV